MLFNIASRLFNLLFVCRTLECSGEAPAEAVAAVDKTKVGGEERRPIGIAMDQPGGGCVPFFRQGIKGFPSGFGMLEDGRNDLTANRIGGVIGIDQFKKGGGDFYGQEGAVAFVKAFFFFA